MIPTRVDTLFFQITLVAICLIVRLNRKASRVMGLVLNSNEWVRNAKGTGDDEPPGSPDSWKDHWLRYSDRRWPDTCSILGCGRNADGGAHVMISGGSTIYIIPMCSQHNNPAQRDPMQVKKNTMAVQVRDNRT